jgi:acyl-[acyl carrier protein]--UDP-N-acetylglucosamine O-acyltransferase
MTKAMMPHYSTRELVTAYPGLATEIVLGTPGYSFPAFDTPQSVPITKEAIVVLKDKGISVIGDHGRDNCIVVDRGQIGMDLRVAFRGRSNCCLIIGKGEGFSGTISFGGDKSLVCFASVGDQGRSAVKVNLDSEATIAYFGAGTTFVNAHFLVEGSGRRLICGDDCMFSWDVFCRNYDSHTIYDLESLARNNDPSDTWIGPHVWVGQGALILKGIKIGEGAIVAARTAVVADVSPSVIVAGSPARVLKIGVGWSRRRFAPPEHLRAEMAILKDKYGPE